MRLYWELARRGYRRHAAYPAATAAGVFTNTMFGFTGAYILLALYRHRDDIGGYDAADTVTYVWLAQGLIATIYVFGWSEIAMRIRTGDVATDLARPAHPLRIGLAFDLGRSLYHAVFRGVPPFVVGALVFDLVLPRQPLLWVAFGVSVFLAVCLSFAFRAIYNLVSFWTLDHRGPLLIGVTTALFFSGFIIPVRFFPDPLEAFARATPFPSMVQVPIDVFVGKLHGLELAGALGLQAFWALALFGIAHGLFAAGTRKLVVQGG